MREPAALWNRALTSLGLKTKKKDSTHSARPRRMWAFEPLEQRQLLSVVTWTGLGSNSNWSTAANWSSSSGPIAGDQLIFSGSTRTATVNNLAAGTSFKSIEFASNNFSVAGNSITLTSGIIVDSGVTGSSISAGIGLSGACTVNVVNTSITISSSVSGSGSLTKTGAGTLILTGTDTYYGGTTISAGALQIGEGGATGSIVGNISNNGQLIVNRSGILALSGSIGDSGSLTKLGSGTLELYGNNYFSGGTTINEGTVKQESDSALGYGNLTMGGGTLDLNGHEVNVTWLNGNSNGSIANSLADSTATLNVYNGGNYQGSIVDDLGGSVALHYFGGGSMTLSGYSNYWGGTTIDGGTVTLGSSWGLGYGNVTINGGVLDMQGHDLYISQLNGSADALVTSYWGNATLYLWNGGSYDGRISDGYGGVVGLYVSGGTLTLGNENPFSGGTTIGGGTVKLGYDFSLGYGNLTMSGGTLDLADHDLYINYINGGSASATITNSVGSSTLNVYGGGQFRGTIRDGAGVMALSTFGEFVLTGDNMYVGGTTISGGTLTLGAGGTTGSVAGNIANNGQLIVNRSNELSYAGIISGTGSLTKTGSGKFIVTGANTYSGGTTIAAGALQLGAGGATGSIAGNVSDSGQLIFNRTGSYAFSGIVSGSGGLTKTGGGTLTLSGANTYTGSTTIAQGILNASTVAVSGGASNLGNAASAVVLGDSSGKKGVLNYTGNSATFTRGFTVQTGGGEIDVATAVKTLTIATGGISNAGSLTFGGAGVTSLSSVITSVGIYDSLNKAGSGTLILNGDNILLGTLTVSSGTVQLGTNSLSGYCNMVLNGGTLDLAGHYLKIWNLDGSSASLISNSSSRSSELDVWQFGTYAGRITDELGYGGVSLQVNGELKLAGSNHFAGGTTITNGGTLIVGSSSALGYGNVTINNGDVGPGRTKRMHIRGVERRFERGDRKQQHDVERHTLDSRRRDVFRSDSRRIRLRHEDDILASKRRIVNAERGQHVYRLNDDSKRRVERIERRSRFRSEQSRRQRKLDHFRRRLRTQRHAKLHGRVDDLYSRP